MDDDKPPPPLDYVPPPVQPVTIPYALVEGWLKLRYDQYLDVRVARTDLDNLFRAFDRNLDAQYSLQECLIRYTNGDTTLANAELQRSRHALQESQNAFRQFFTAIMASVLRSDAK